MWIFLFAALVSLSAWHGEVESRSLLSSAVNIHQYDAFLPFPDRSTLNSIEVYHSRKEIEAVLNRLDPKSMKKIGTPQNDFLCFTTLPDSTELDAEEVMTIGAKDDLEIEKVEETIDNVADSVQDRGKSIIGDDRKPEVEQERNVLRIILENIRSNLEGKCFERRINYWTYKVCPFKLVQQVHYDYGASKRNSKLTQAINLGSYDEPEDVKSPGDNFDYKAKIREFSIQQFLDGDDQRKTTVHFRCPLSRNKESENNQNSAKAPNKKKGTNQEFISHIDCNIVSVIENEPHVYVIQVESDYFCLLENISKADSYNFSTSSDIAVSGTYDASAKADYTDHTDSITKVTKILQSYDHNCIQYISGWWTYEVCFGVHVRQFHKSKEKHLDDEFFMGFYKEQESAVKIVDSLKYGRKVAVQMYSDGTECDLTGHKRSTEVVYKCANHYPANSLDGVKSPVGLTLIEFLSVEERVSCGYTIVISMPQFCSIPGFPPDALSQNKLKLEKTICVPEEAIIIA